MTLPATGPLTRTQIRTEFGLPSTARWPTDYLGLYGLPTARPLKFSDFHGKSNLPPVPVFNPAPGTVSGGPGAYTINADRPVIWTFSYVGHAVSFDRTNGETGAEITMNMGVNNTFTVWTSTVTVTATFNSITYTWTVDMSDPGLN